MSGPKISIYDLTGPAREIVLGQMQCEQQSLVCVSHILSMLKELASSADSLDKVLAQAQELQRDHGGQEDIIRDINALKERINTDLDKMNDDLTCNMPEISFKYTISFEALEKKKRDLMRLQSIQQQVSGLKNAIREMTVDGPARQKQQIIVQYLSEEDHTTEIAKKSREELEASIADGFGTYIDFEIEEEQEISFDERKVAVKKQLMELLKEDLSEKLTAEVYTAISNLEGITQPAYLRNFGSVTVKRLFGNIKSYHLEQEALREKEQELRTRYQTLCQLAGKEEDKDRAFDSAQEIEKEIKRLEAVIIKRHEQDYISDCVDEIMSEMGYDLLGKREVRKKSGKQFRNELFRFGEGTAVNVTYSPEGQISMELGGISRQDRLPSDAETEILTKDMETFCGEFAEFENRLKEKGVVLGNRIAMLPPTAEYASIINVNDYDIQEGKQISEMSITSKRGKAVEKKTLRRDE